MVVVGDLWRFVNVRSGLAIKKLWMRSCWPLARRRQHQSTGGEERQGREPAGQSILRWPQRQCDNMKKTMEMRRTDKWLESDQRGGDLV